MESIVGARAFALEVLDAVGDLESSRAEGADETEDQDGHTTNIFASAKGLVFLKYVRAGLVVAGVAHGSGFAISRTMRGQWSAPCFVTLTRLEVGALAGFEQVASLMAAITRRGLELLASGTRQSFGTDVTVRPWPIPLQQNAIDALNVDSDWIVANVQRKGVFIEFGLTAGFMSADESLNRKVYGKDINAEDILHGIVPRPPEMESLYRRIDEIAFGHM